MTETIEPFQIGVDDDVLDDLQRRLERTRYVDGPDADGWDAGMPSTYLRELVGYWHDDYDWRAREAELNELDHYTTRIDGTGIHFAHVRSAEPDAMPLLLVHGWPGSFVEFCDAIPRLVDPQAHGGEAADAFHVVVPSLPGYGFSEAPSTPGWDPLRIAETFVELMARLGYDRYGAQGGDWGAQVTTRMAAIDAGHCVGLHLNMPLALPPEEPIELSAAEQADLAALAEFRRDEAAYSQIQMTKPETLGAALNDSPAGLLAWIVEKFRGWSDCGGDPENAFSRDQMIDNVMIYWVSQSITSSMRLYREARLARHRGDKPDYVGVPTGVARYPKEVLRYPRAWVERHYNVTHWAELPRGGHFAAMEQPELFTADVAQFFATLR